LTFFPTTLADRTLVPALDHDLDHELHQRKRPKIDPDQHHQEGLKEKQALLEKEEALQDLEVRLLNAQEVIQPKNLFN
jgi:hypothetical protein